MGSVAIGSSTKSEDPTNSVTGARLGSLLGGGIGMLQKDRLMKLINPLKSDQGAGLCTLIVLIIRCIVCIFILAIVGCALGRLMVFLKTNELFFDWWKDLVYSLEVAFYAGVLAGFGIWIKAKIQGKNEDSN